MWTASCVAALVVVCILRGIIHRATLIQRTIVRTRTAIHPEWRTIQPVCDRWTYLPVHSRESRLGVSCPLPFVGPYGSHRGCVMSIPPSLVLHLSNAPLDPVFSDALWFTFTRELLTCHQSLIVFGYRPYDSTSVMSIT